MQYVLNGYIHFRVNGRPRMHSILKKIKVKYCFESFPDTLKYCAKHIPELLNQFSTELLLADVYHMTALLVNTICVSKNGG